MLGWRRTNASRRRDLPLEGQILLLVTLVLVAFGQVMVYSASSAYALTHDEFGHDPLHFVKAGAIYTVAGVVALLVVMRARPSWLRVAGPLILVVSLGLLVAVLIPGIGVEVNGARRWLAFGPLTFQPSELAKIGLLGTCAALLAARRHAPERIADLVPIAAVSAFACGLVLVEPDLGTAISMALMIGGMLIVAGIRTGLLLRVALVAATLGTLAIVAEPYRRDRFLAFLDPWSQSGDGAYQVVQAMIAIGSGGVTGVGLGGSVQKVNYLPEAHTDMIFAVIGEELGLVGALFVIVLFATFAWAGFTIALRARDRFSQLVAAGATSLVAGQAVVNLCAVMGIMPLTGIPLPLISHGSSSRVATLFLVGVLLAISRESVAIAAAAGREPEAGAGRGAAARRGARHPGAASPPRRRAVAFRAGWRRASSSRRAAPSVTSRPRWRSPTSSSRAARRCTSPARRSASRRRWCRRAATPSTPSGSPASSAG